MRRLQSILAVAILALLGSGSLSVMHRAVHHAGSGCAGGACADAHLSLAARQLPHASATTCAEAACHHACTAPADVEGESNPAAPAVPAPTSEGECGFCMLLALPAASPPFAVATMVPLCPRIVRPAPPPEVIRVRLRIQPEQRGPPRA